MPTTIKKTSTGRFGTRISEQKNPKLAHIFLSHIFLSTFGCGMTALGHPCPSFNTMMAVDCQPSARAYFSVPKALISG